MVSTLPEICNYVSASSNDFIFKSFIFISFSAIYNMYFNSEIENSLLTFALFLIYLALQPNLKVDTVSDSLNILGLQVIIRDVFELPPKDSYNILVNFESRYGTCYDLPSVKALITQPKAVKDLLIF